LIIPTHIDVSTYFQLGKWVYQPLLDMLVKRNLNFLDVGPQFIQHRGKPLYDPKSRYHLSEEGNQVLAEIVYDYLRQNHFTRQIHLADLLPP
jgi:lysophospholipase L1-like esterase